MVVSPKDPPGSFSCLGIAAMPERTLAAFVSGVGPGVDRGHGMDGQHPGHPPAEPGSICRPKTGEKAVTSPGWLGTDSFGDPAAQAGYKGWAGEPPLVNHQPAVAVASWRLGWLAVVD